jgi:7-carboxy-7-deazaguanine synthase
MTASPPIAETFASIQGEGGLAGTPSFFIRVSGCNLRCIWCDTPHASWNPEGDHRTIESLVSEARASGLDHIVITGGEPMMFSQIEPLCAALKKDHRREASAMKHSSPTPHITIETAGTIFRDLDCDLMSISPKLSNSTPGLEHGEWSKRHEARRLDFTDLQQLIDHFPQRQFKFVVTGEDDLAEVDAILARLRGWRDDEIFLMPEGVTTPTRERRERVLAMCRSRNWRYGPRLHIELFGHVRGT